MLILEPLALSYVAIVFIVSSMPEMFLVTMVMSYGSVLLPHKKKIISRTYDLASRTYDLAKSYVRLS